MSDRAATVREALVCICGAGPSAETDAHSSRCSENRVDALVAELAAAELKLTEAAWGDRYALEAAEARAEAAERALREIAAFEANQQTGHFPVDAWEMRDLALRALAASSSAPQEQTDLSVSRLTVNHLRHLPRAALVDAEKEAEE